MGVNEILLVISLIVMHVTIFVIGWGVGSIIAVALLNWWENRNRDQ